MQDFVGKLRWAARLGGFHRRSPTHDGLWQTSLRSSRCKRSCAALCGLSLEAPIEYGLTRGVWRNLQSDITTTFLLTPLTPIHIFCPFLRLQASSSKIPPIASRNDQHCIAYNGACSMSASKDFLCTRGRVRRMLTILPSPLVMHERHVTYC